MSTLFDQGATAYKGQGSDGPMAMRMSAADLADEFTRQLVGDVGDLRTLLAERDQALPDAWWQQLDDLMAGSLLLIEDERRSAEAADTGPQRVSSAVAAGLDAARARRRARVTA